jgi:hypothetical protein
LRALVVGCLGFDDAGPLPATSTDVFQPHRGTLVLGAPRVSHRIDIHRQGVGEATLHIVGEQIDEEYRQFAVPSSSGNQTHVVLRRSVA